MSNRNNRADSDTRKTRSSEERTLTENRTFTDEQRLTIFKQKFGQAELPDIPPIDGYHVFWATTTNARDPVVNRLRVGYELIRAEDVPGMNHVTVKTGEYAGCIGVNEMLAMKIPLRIYHQMMQHNHHDAPMQNANGIYDTIQGLQAEAEEHKGKVEVDPGFNNLKADTRLAQFDN